jgi:3-hydroxyacyl-[acyl-carrier-protein] dehydratase
MLKDNFFLIAMLHIENDVIKATLELNEKHTIFDGHFPEKPVVPGVCMMQLVKEVTETALRKELRLTKAAEIKFLKIIDPNETRIIHIQLKYNTEEDGAIIFVASLFKDSLIYFKIKGSFQQSELTR